MFEIQDFQGGWRKIAEAEAVELLEKYFDADTIIALLKESPMREVWTRKGNIRYNPKESE